MATSNTELELEVYFEHLAQLIDRLELAAARPDTHELSAIVGDFKSTFVAAVGVDPWAS